MIEIPECGIYQCEICGNRSLVLTGEAVPQHGLAWVVRCGNGHDWSPTVDVILELHHCHQHVEDSETA